MVSCSLCLDFFLFPFFMETHLSSFIYLKSHFRKINFITVLEPQTAKKKETALNLHHNLPQLKAEAD